ncbi:Transcriptional activator hac1 [Erysiphe neolycopersici]|uniref:Transcriptional activator hac1 n=1 Tax=Erysiphe neolycopersici TaxID=212602 RepID=A0A420HM38_9PEZI|nr:Transcriptional activator hac1 [Erysiphe neolycopersici]
MMAMETTAQIKYEDSPIENELDSFVTTSGSFYPTLFDNTINPNETLIPQSLDGDSLYNATLAGITSPEKKPVKKRKSWGQQLPEPKTNLPPRKRAKTEDEKEQRRVERVLRNRRAAQSSRERKRQEVEALEAEKRAIERKNMDLEMRLADLRAKYHLLQMEVEWFDCGKNSLRSYSGTSSSHSPELRHPSPVTFSMELFGSQDEIIRPISPRSISSPASGTLDPTTLSPESLSSMDSPGVSPSDLSQHSTSMMYDQQCQSEAFELWMDLTSATSIIM